MPHGLQPQSMPFTAKGELMRFTSMMKGALCLAATSVAPAALAACLAAEVEPNNSDRQASTGLCSGVAASGSISSAKDEDWFRIDVAAPGDIAISLSHDSGINLDWYLHNGGNSALTFRATMSNPETGTFTASAAGTYYVRVKSQSGSGR